MYGLIHDQVWNQFNADVSPAFVFQDLGLQRSAALRFRGVTARRVPVDNTWIKLTTLATAENAASAKVQYIDFYPTISDSPVCCTVAECQLFFAFPTMPDHNVQVTPCERHRNIVCQCEDGYYRFYINSETYECLKCKRCDPNQKESQRCESTNKRKSVKRSDEKQINCCHYYY